MTVSLSEHALTRLPYGIQRYSYDRAQVKSGILHIGPSAFFRAHLAVYVDDMLSRLHKEGKPLDWGIIAVSMKHPTAHEKLAPQDFLYTLTSLGKDQQHTRVIGSIKDILVANQNPQAVLEAAADPGIKLITLTVTQKGYYFSSEKGFDFDHPDIKACLDEGSVEMSSIGLIVSSLDLRRQRGIAPPTIMSCDNLAGNGTTLRNAVLAYAQKKSPELRAWIEEYVAFPNEMVDRITPKTTPEHEARMKSMGVVDAWPIQAEYMPNVAFVIEGNRSIDPNTGHPVDFPPLKDPSLYVVDNVHAYEMMKVRTLNGAHMALGCIGHLSGLQHTHEAMAQPDIRAFIQGFMKEVGQTLPDIEGVSLPDYQQDLVTRLDNSEICDQLTRLARNGTDKVGSRFLDTLRDSVASGQSSSHTTFALASWIQYLKQLDQNGRLPGSKKTDEPNDAAASRAGLDLVNIVYPGMTDPSPLFAVDKIFGKDLSNNPAFVQQVKTYLTEIENLGISAALKKFVTDNSAPDVGTQPVRHLNGTGQPYAPAPVI
ncbi:MAG: mannitol dehydrogenase family protein [Alphaproteobacteria bacterium]|nr:mannitol dehydrogenase family protein [Alphaproteobacteria bacterium]